MCTEIFFLTLFAWFTLVLISSLGIFCYGWVKVWHILKSASEAMAPHVWQIPLATSFTFLVQKYFESASWIRWIFVNHPFLLKRIIQEGGDVFMTLLFVTQFIFERVQLFLLSSSELLAACFIGFVDGLVQRDLRKFCNARESTLFFHQCKLFIANLFFSGYFLLIVTPYPIRIADWMAIFSLFSLVIGFGICLMMKQFKKHL